MITLNEWLKCYLLLINLINLVWNLEKRLILCCNNRTGSIIFWKKIKRVSVVSKSFIEEIHSLVSLCMICLKSINHWLAGNKKETLDMLSVTLKESILFFDNKYWSQIGKVAMNSPLGPTLANILLCYHESTWLNDYLKDFRPVCWGWYFSSIW